MNRSLRFRAWWAKKDNAPYAITTITDKMLYDKVPGDCFRWKSEGQKLTVMQYTGSNDKNGVKIYEGDVVRLLNGEDWVVEWYGTGWTLRCTCHYPYGDFYGLNGQEATVIGNIFENPELLEAKT